MKARPHAPSTEWTFTGRHMLLLMVAFFGVILGVNILLAVASSTTWSGLVVQNSYVASQEFQVKRDAMERQQAQGWTPHFSYEHGNASFVIRDAGGHPVDLGAITLQIHRPIGTREDIRLALEPVRIGEYAAAVTLAAGVWDVQVIGPETRQGPFEYNHRFTVEAVVQ